jgi:hypothetical protein
MVTPLSRGFPPVTHNVIHKNCALFAAGSRRDAFTRRDWSPGALSRRLNIQRLAVRPALIADYERQGLLQFADTGLRDRVYALPERAQVHFLPPPRSRREHPASGRRGMWSG